MQYFALDGGVGYKKILQHFREQALGKGKTRIIPSPAYDKRRPRNKNQMVLIDLADTPETDNKDKDVMPKIEVMDPVEAERKRAMDQLQREIEEKRDTENPPKRRRPPTTSHSRKDLRKTNTNKRRKRDTVQTVVKRTKDIFD